MHNLLVIGDQDFHAERLVLRHVHLQGEATINQDRFGALIVPVETDGFRVRGPSL